MGVCTAGLSIDKAFLRNSEMQNEREQSPLGCRLHHVENTTANHQPPEVQRFEIY
jgi:hypothetical protein